MFIFKAVSVATYLLSWISAATSKSTLTIEDAADVVQHVAEILGKPLSLNVPSNISKQTAKITSLHNRSEKPDHRDYVYPGSEPEKLPGPGLG